MNALVPAVSTTPSLSTQADTDAQLIELWLHGRSLNTRLAYESDIARFNKVTGCSRIEGQNDGGVRFKGLIKTDRRLHLPDRFSGPG